MSEPDGPPSPPRSGALAPSLVPEDQRVAPELVRALEEMVDDVARRPFSRDLIKRLEWLIEILIVRGHLTRSHAKLINRIKGDASVVRLAVYRDKRAVQSTERDCATLLPLCKGRCCAMDVSLSEEDLAEGKLTWDLHQPYLLRKHPDHGYCGCLDGAARCTVYDDRPGTCRDYDCAHDPRVWLDFDNKIPAPMPWFLVPPEEWAELAAGRRPPVDLPMAGPSDDDGLDPDETDDAADDQPGGPSPGGGAGPTTSAG